MTQLKAMVLLVALVYSAGLVLVFGQPAAGGRNGLNGELIFLASAMVFLVSAVLIGRMSGAADEVQKRRAWGAAKIEELMAQRDTAWHELREIRQAIDANPEEATIDEVRAMVARLHELEAREQEA